MEKHGVPLGQMVLSGFDGCSWIESQSWRSGSPISDILRLMFIFLFGSLINNKQYYVVDCCFNQLHPQSPSPQL